MLIGLVILMLIGLMGGEPVGTNVAIIPIEGVITTNGAGGAFSPAGASSSHITTFLKSADEDDRIEAIVLKINSPGGSAVASDEIARAVEDVNKPVIAWIREAGASGAFWIATEADHVIANRMSITGSVGVIASYLEFNGFLEDHNITYRKLTAGKYKDTGNPFAELTQEQAELLQEKLDRTHGFFLDDVQENRNLTDEVRAEIETGIFFLGIEAYELGLIDELGGEQEVMAYLETYLGEEPQFRQYEPPRSFMEELLGVKQASIPEFSIRS